MLISPILTVMSFYRWPGGQLLSRGYVANFSQDINQLCKTLPRLTKDIPLLIVKKVDQNNNSNDFKMNRYRVETLLKYLCENNPDWKKNNIKYNFENINKLPINGIPNDLNEIVNPTTLDTFDKIIIESGPAVVEETITECDHTIQITIESDIETPFQVDRIEQFIKCNWPLSDSNPINDFTFDGLASLAFPSLFPHGLADPTKKGRLIAVSETDGYKNLLKYATRHTKSNEYYYPYSL